MKQKLTKIHSTKICMYIYVYNSKDSPLQGCKLKCQFLYSHCTEVSFLIFSLETEKRLKNKIGKKNILQFSTTIVDAKKYRLSCKMYI